MDELTKEEVDAVMRMREAKKYKQFFNDGLNEAALYVQNVGEQSGGGAGVNTEPYKSLYYGILNLRKK